MHWVRMQWEKREREQINGWCMWMWVYGKESQSTWSLCISTGLFRIENVSVVLSHRHLPCMCWDVCCDVTMNQESRKEKGHLTCARLLCLLLLILLPVGTFFPLESSLGCEEKENAHCKIKCRFLSLSLSLSPFLFLSYSLFTQLVRTVQVVFLSLCCSLSSWVQVNPLHLLNLLWITRISGSFLLLSLSLSHSYSLWLFFQFVPSVLFSCLNPHYHLLGQDEQFTFFRESRRGSLASVCTVHEVEVEEEKVEKR